VLVELPRLRVSLEDPEPKAVRPQLLDQVEEGAAGALPVELRIDVEVVEEILAETEEADDLPVELGHPDLLVREHDLAYPLEDVLGAVRVGKIDMDSRRARTWMSVSAGASSGMALLIENGMKPSLHHPFR